MTGFDPAGAHRVHAAHLRPGKRFSMDSDAEAYTRNAQVELEKSMSLVMEVLTGVSDLYVRTVILNQLNEVAVNLRKALI